MKVLRVLPLVGAMAVLAPASKGQFFESEPNDSKAQANNVFGILPGQFIQGNSTSATGVGLDYFLVKTASAPLGIYRYRLVITSNTVGHTGTIRGLNQIAAAPGVWSGNVGTPGTTDSTAQTTSTATTPPRYNQWYGFGKEELLYYRVTGTTTTTEDYVATLERVTVSPVHVGFFNPGLIDIRTFGVSNGDSDLWVYDSQFNAIVGYGNDDESVNSHPGGSNTGATVQSILRRTYSPGIYYLALSPFNLANNQPSPEDDDFRTGTILDFPDAVLSSSTLTTAVLDFRISDGVNTVTTPYSRTAGSQFDVGFFSFTVVPEPGTMLAFGAGLAGLAAMRRRSRR